MTNANETFMVLIVVGTLALIFMMKGSTCFSGGGGHPSHCGCYQCRHGLIGIPKDGLSGVPYSSLEGVPYSGLAGIPDSLEGVPYSGLAGIPDSLEGVPNTMHNFNPDELGANRFGSSGLTGLTGLSDSLTGIPYENFADPNTGVLSASHTVWGDRNKSDAAWKKVEAARLSGNYSTAKYTSGDIGDLSTTCSFAPKYSDALECMGLPVGGPDSWYSWDDSDSKPTRYLETTDLATKCALVANDYQDAMKCMSLEPDVSNSHSTWISNIQGKTTTASKDTVRDGAIDINPWIGLRRPKYKTRAQPLAESRTIPSEIPSEMLDNSGSYTI
jgi:hypothetical protein